MLIRIQTDWNLKKEAGEVDLLGQFIRIQTDWNLKLGDIVTSATDAAIRIQTDWNLKRCSRNYKSDERKFEFRQIGI